MMLVASTTSVNVRVSTDSEDCSKLESVQWYAGLEVMATLHRKCTRKIHTM